MQPLANSTFLDYQAYGLTTATTVAAAYGFDPSAAFVAPPETQVTVALMVNRANDPTALLNEDWATREQTLAAMNANNTLWTTYGAEPTVYDNMLSTLQGDGYSVLGPGQGYVQSTAARTIWVQLDAAQFQSLFGTPLMFYPGSSGHPSMLFWNGSLALPDAIAGNIAGLWLTGANFGSTPQPTDTLLGTTLPDGPQSPGNSASPHTDLFPSGVADNYSFPLDGTNQPTPTIGLIEPGVGDGLPPGSNSFQSLLDQYRTTAGVPTGTGHYVDNPDGITITSSGERSLDVGIVATATPYSTIGLYVGGNNDSTVFSAYQSAIWDTTNNPQVISSSDSDDNQSSPDSPFYNAYRQLFIDAALRNITLIHSAGDGGSQAKYGNGVPMQHVLNTSPYAIAVGGTSMVTLGDATNDPTLQTLLASAQSLDPATLRNLAAAGLTTLPTDTASLTTLLTETVWNQYTVDNSTGTITDFFSNYTTGGGVDTTQPTPSYQTEFGLSPTSNSPDPQTGRGVPDVAANAGGDTFYKVPNADMAALTGEGGTSAAAPLWASLTAQIQALFAIEGLPSTGYYNDLLYTAAAIVPASFNDVTIGNNTSTFVYGGTQYTDDGVAITPTGYGYQAGPGYDLTTGLGTPNGTILARTLAAIAHAQLYSNAPPVSDPTGNATGAAEALLVQPTLVGTSAVKVEVGGSDGTFTGAASGSMAWSNQLAEQVLQSGYDPNLIAAFEPNASQSAPTTLNVAANSSISITIGNIGAISYQTALTSPFGFDQYIDGVGDAITLARPVSIAQTALGANGQQAIVRIRQTTSDPVELTFYRVDDLLGTIDGVAPGNPLYAQLAASRAYQTAGDSSVIAGPGDGQYTQTALLGVNQGDIIAASLQDGSNTYWSFAGANESVDGTPVTHVWNYGLNTFGFDASYGGGGSGYNDLIYQLDFTSADTPLACFAAGTRITSARGPVDVADLREGDLLPTIIGGTPQPICWIGHRRIDCRRHPRPEQVWPVRVAADAFGDGQPGRDLFLSPDHAIYALDSLIPVKYLLNGSSIRQVPRDTVTYYHLELPRHDVLLAEGLACESYLDTGNRANFTNANAPARLFPDFSSLVWEAAGCAPLTVAGPQFDAVRRQLAQRARPRRTTGHQQRRGTISAQK